MNVISRTDDFVGSKSVAGRATPITADECRAHVVECLRLRNTGNISSRRVAALMAMMTSWVALANQIEHYEAILKDEESTVAQ